MKSQCVVCSLSLLAGIAVSLPARADITLYVDFFRQQGVNPAAPFVFYADPSTTEAWISTLTVSSHDGNLTGNLGGAGSPLDSFSDIKSSVENTWTMTVNGTDTYHFTLSLNNITEADFPQVDIATPPNGATGVPTTPTYTWNDPAPRVPFASVSYEIIPDFNGGFGYPPPNPLALGTTSLTSPPAAPSPLNLNSSYGFNLIYWRDASSQANAGDNLTGTDPMVMDPTGAPVNFNIVATLYDQASSTFTTVPEPSKFGVLGALGLLGFAARKRMKA